MEQDSGEKVGPEVLAKHFARCIVLRVAELPDRTSPEDWPEAMLVTADELTEIVESELVENIREGAARPADPGMREALRIAEEVAAQQERDYGAANTGGADAVVEALRAALSPDAQEGAEVPSCDVMRKTLELIRDRHFTDEAGDREWVEWARSEAAAALKAKEQGHG